MGVSIRVIGFSCSAETSRYNASTPGAVSRVALRFHSRTQREPFSRAVDTAAAGKYKPDIVPTISQLFSLAGRVAIVTGGSRGLGQEMAEGLGEAGCALMLCARRSEWLQPSVDAMRARGFRVEGMLCDVAKPPDVQAVVDKTV